MTIQKLDLPFSTILIASSIESDYLWGTVQVYELAVNSKKQHVPTNLTYWPTELLNRGQL
jgi:hypothetical protein